jgi:dihydroxyacetone kinase-like predicted kinase
MFNTENADKTVKTLDGRDLKDMLVFAVERLAKSEEELNALNVFPVPDGDTGRNMLLTMCSGLEEAQRSNESSVADILEKVAYGALLGARGNSGVILSQIWKGMSVSAQEKESIDSIGLANALKNAAEAAYQSMVNPVEGTMLTVMKEMADAAVNSLGYSNGNIIRTMKAAVEAGKRAVASTPELLPVLKEAGVVDSGGQGLYILFDGALKYLNGQTEGYEQGELKLDSASASYSVDVRFEGDPTRSEVNNDICFNTGVVAIATGGGIIDIFTRLGASFIIPGGPTMNPSAKQIWQAVEETSADKVIILPNDKNLILATQKIETLTKKEVLVIPTVTIPQGIAALLAFDPEADLMTNFKLMTESSLLVKTISVTRATRDTRVNGLNIRKGQAIGLLDDQLISVSDDTKEAVVKVLDRIDMANIENASIYYGSDTEQAEAEKTRELMYLKNTRLNVEVIHGGQPLYNYIISIE